MGHHTVIDLVRLEHFNHRFKHTRHLCSRYVWSISRRHRERGVGELSDANTASVYYGEQRLVKRPNGLVVLLLRYTLICEKKIGSRRRHVWIGLTVIDNTNPKTPPPPPERA